MRRPCSAAFFLPAPCNTSLKSKTPFPAPLLTLQKNFLSGPTAQKYASCLLILCDISGSRKKTDQKQRFFIVFKQRQ